LEKLRSVSLFLAPILLLFTTALHAADPPPLRWGGDKAGGAPFIFEEPGKGDIGFEVELIAYLAERINRKPEFVQADWDALPDTLGRGNIDIAFNGFEYVQEREKEFPSTVPYFVYSLRLIVAANNKDIRSWDDLRKPKAGKYRVGVLNGSAAHKYLTDNFGDDVVVVPSKEVSEALDEVEAGARLDATVQDSPAAVYYVQGGRRPKLKVVGEAAAKGYYVILTRPDATELRQQLNDAIKEARKSGKLEAIYRKYGLWDGDQERLSEIHEEPWPPAEKEEPRLRLSNITGKLAKATWLTIALAFASMPIAIIIGILVALGRLYGAAWLRWLLTAYVEVLRGTPLLLQMYVWFFLIPSLARMTGWEFLVELTTLDPFIVGVWGLALNYSAAEAENYRAGLQAIPKGQMEAALALGMSPAMAVRKVILPQAIRIVIPPVTNDFIALFKDTSVCSTIMITELTGLYYQYKNNRHIVLELAITIAVIYLLISYPLSLLAGYLERRLSGGKGTT
jgi:polar amino acid transport system substrate-binding protein